MPMLYTATAIHAVSNNHNYNSSSNNNTGVALSSGSSSSSNSNRGRTGYSSLSNNDGIPPGVLVARQQQDNIKGKKNKNNNHSKKSFSAFHKTNPLEQYLYHDDDDDEDDHLDTEMALTISEDSPFLIRSSVKSNNEDDNNDGNNAHHSWSLFLQSFSRFLLPCVIIFLLAWKLFFSHGSSLLIDLLSNSNNDSSSSVSNEGLSNAAYEVDDNCATCPISRSYCTDNTYPVMGGIDLVATYESYSNSTTYQTRATIGSPVHKVTYEGYIFLFKSFANRQKFNQNPTKYLPQWGGFCAWGMSAEFCPQYAWDKDCLGPSGNWYSWNLFENKLYFFLKKDPLQMFSLDSTSYIEEGDKRWKAWFGDSLILNTRCSKSEDG